MPGFDPNDYEPVEARISKFYADHPEGRITTTLIVYEDPLVIVRAEVYRDEVCPVTTSGYAQETVGQGVVNKTSALENCETSAIGRALANLDYAAKARPSREEMLKTVPEQKGEGHSPSSGDKAGPGAEGYGEGSTPPDAGDAPSLDDLIAAAGSRAKARAVLNETAGTSYTAATMPQASPFELQLAIAALQEAVPA